jgi:murein peptide amidase A
MRPRWITRLMAVALALMLVAALSILEWNEAHEGLAGMAGRVADHGNASGARTSGMRIGAQGLVHRRTIVGESVRDRPIRAEEIGNPTSQQRLMVVGCLHGNECAGIAIAKALALEPPPTNADIWIVYDLNPDGHALGTRQNARGVDLNRNFPYRWRPIGVRGSVFYSGTRPDSEPETRAAVAFIDGLRPATSIWFHQHLDVVDLSGGNAAVERSYAHLVHLPTARLPRYPGSATTWQNHAFPGTTAFVVELPRAISRPSAERYADAALALIGA